MTASDSITQERATLSRTDRLMHNAAAWGAVLCFLTPLLHGWTIHGGEREWPVRIWPGHLLIDAVELVLFTLLGLVAGGWWWWSAAWRRGWAGITSSAGLLGLGVLAIGGRLTPIALGAVLAVWFVYAAVVIVVCPRRRSQRMREYVRERRPWNAVFFVSLVILNTGSDVLMIGGAPPGWLAAAAFVAGRLLTQVVIASGIWLLLALASRWSPGGSNWVGWTAVILIPLLVIVDMLLRLMWTKSLIHLCMEIESGGKVDLLKIREGGLSVTAGQKLTALACLAGAVAWYFLCQWLSQRGRWRTSPLRYGGMALTAWVLLMALQVVESVWKSPAWRHWERRAVMLHLTPFSPPPGVVTFRVAAADPVLAAPAAAKRKPDIFLFIVETMRADAVHPERTPFLARWKDEECQQLAETRAASNATHLSWFSILHGRLPYFHDKIQFNTAPAPLLDLLHGAGYRLEVRSAGNFDYCNMRTCNFGDGGIISVMEHVPEYHPDYRLPKAECERRVMERLRESVAQSQRGGVLRLTTIDSAHYPYRWHNDWTPPYADFEKNPVFPVRPSPDEIDRVRRRYWNSIAWCDHLVGDFINYLKASGRYDASMIILTGDHGEEFKEHGSWFHCSALNGEQTRVPILIKWPAEMGRGPALNDASHLDIVPSILDAAGFDESAWRGMPGRSLRRDRPATSIISTCYNSQNSESMVWRRDGWEAAFSWPSPWLPVPPEKLWLERLESPAGPVECDGAGAWEAVLRRQFPDAFVRLFSSCEAFAP